MFKNYPGKMLFVLLLLCGSMQLNAQTARVQVIHNCADDIADSVDVYLNGTLLLDDFAFRSATPFINAPAGVAIDIDVAPKTSTSVANSIYNLNTTLTAGETYVVVAAGITGLSSTTYSSAPAFELDVYAMGREQANMMGNTDVLVYHGATDAPTVDIYESAVLNATASDDLVYSDFDGYLELPANDYVLEVRDATGATVVASYDAPLQALGLTDSAITVLASGFLNPAANGNGPSFGLFAALPTGGNLVALPSSTARIQVIHNCADDIADSVDVYLNGTLLLDNFAFRTATPFIDAPAGVAVDIDVAPKTSTSVANSIYNLNATLTSGETYAVVAAGITGLSATSYSVSPAFELDVFPMAREAATTAGNTDILVYHGSTDAPTVDIYESAVLNATASDDLMYSDFDGYLELPTDDYVIEVRDASGAAVVASYEAPLQTLGLNDAAITVLASGFLDPSSNGNGPAFGLYVALPAGGNLVALPSSTARIQVIHNCADDIADSVDVYLNGTLLLDNFAFRTATPFIDAPAGVAIDIDVAPKTSTSVANSIYNLNTTLTAGETYVVVAAGITGLSSTTYSSAPAFELDVYAMGREQANMMGNTDVLVYHGATDAPTVDIYENGILNATASDDLMYSDFDGYLELPTNNYILEVRDASGASVVASYLAPLQNLGLQDSAITVLASGFLDPSLNGNGPAFGLYAALAKGGALVALPPGFIGVDEEKPFEVAVYPNPNRGRLFIEGNETYAVTITDLSGKLVMQKDEVRNSLDISTLSNGIYNVSISSHTNVMHMKLIKE